MIVIGSKNSIASSLAGMGARSIRPSRKNPAVARFFACRPQSTSTMDLVSMDESRSKCNKIYATLQFSTERDFSSVASDRRPDPLAAENWNALVAAASTLHQSMQSCMSQEMDLVQASEQRHNFDKIILMINHGEDESQIPGMEDATDSLTGRGVGQALSLSRRAASFCNAESGLTPELVLVTPFRKVLQTTFLSFPYHTPHQSLRCIPWICLPYSKRQFDLQHTSLADLQREFPGIDYSLCLDREDQLTNDALNERLLRQAGDFVQWLQDQDERIIVVAGDAAWLQALGFTLGYTGAVNDFNNGEMRAVGVRFG